MKDNENTWPPVDCKHPLQVIITFATVTSAMLVLVLVPVVKLRLFTNPAFYLFIALCGAWLPALVAATTPLRKRHRTRLLAVVAPAGFLVGILGSAAVGDVLLKPGRSLGPLVFMAVLIVSGFVVILVNILQARTAKRPKPPSE